VGAIAEPDVRGLRREFGGEYEITAIGGELFAWRHDGTTATLRAGGPARLRAAIMADRRDRPRVPHAGLVS
jgi:hypothetical protein